jgi:hypothetical protein
LQHVAARRRRAPVTVNQTAPRGPPAYTMAESSQSDEKLDLKVSDSHGALTHFKVKKTTKFRKILTARPRRPSSLLRHRRGIITIHAGVRQQGGNRRESYSFDG